MVDKTLAELMHEYFTDPSTASAGVIQSAIGANSDVATSGGNWSGDTYTGTGERITQNYVSVNLQVDESGTLFFEFSQDNLNWGAFPVAGFPVVSGINEVHAAFKFSYRYFRVRFVGTGGRTYFRLLTEYSNNVVVLNSPLSQTLSGDQDASTVKSVAHGEDVQNDGTFVKGKMTVDGATLVAPSTSMVRKLFLSYYFIDVDENTDRIDYYDTTDAGTRVAFRTITYVSGSNKSQISSNVVTNL